MGDRYISQLSTVAAELTSGQGHALTMASRQDDLLGKISEMEKSMDKLPEMEKILGQLFDLMKSITQELCLQGPSPAITTTPLPPSTVTEYHNPNHEAHDLYQNLPDAWEHASMTVNQGEARSICLLVSSYGDGIYTNAVYEVKFKHGGEVPVIRHVAKFREGYCPRVARVFNRSNLYYFGDYGGFIVDMETWSKCSSITPTPASNSRETIVYAYDKVYYLARRTCLRPVKEPSFGRYDHNQKVWEKMTPFPFYDDYDHHMRMTGYAVCHGVILFSLCGLINGDFCIVAFNVGRMDWNRVKFDTSACLAPPFQGRAVVVGKTIYALYGETEIIAFSFQMEKGGDDDIAYSLSQLFILQCLEFARPLMPWFDDLTQCLVHLGNHDFFYVQTGWCDSHLKVQYLSITTFQIVVGEGGGHMIKIIHSTVHSVDIKGSEWFDLVLCFTPECEDYEHTEEESMASMNQPRQEITAMKLEIEATQHEEAIDAQVGY